MATDSTTLMFLLADESLSLLVFSFVYLVVPCRYFPDASMQYCFLFEVRIGNFKFVTLDILENYFQLD